MEQTIERSAFETPFDDLGEDPKPKGGNDNSSDGKDPKPAGSQDVEQNNGNGEANEAEGANSGGEIERKDVDTSKGGSDPDPKGGEGSEGSKSKELSQNDVYNLAMHWKKEGYLPEDVEVDEDISDAELSELYRTAKEEPIRKEIEQSRIEELKKKGYNDRDLRNARLISQGIDPREIIETDNFEALARVEIPEEGDQRLDMQKRLLAIDYRNQGITDDKKIQRLIDISVEEGEIDGEVKAAQERFAKTAEQKRQEHEKAASEKEKKKAKRVKENIERINNYIEERKVGDKTYPKKVMNKVKNAFFKKDQVYEVDGEKRRGTLWQKIQDRKKKDPDFAMEMIIRQIAGDDLAPDPEDIERKHSDKLISGLSAGGSSEVSRGGSGNNNRRPPGEDNATIERRSLI